MTPPKAALRHAPLASTPTVEHFDGAAVAADPQRWVRAYERVYADELGLVDQRDPPVRERLLRHAARPGYRPRRRLNSPSPTRG